MTRYILIDSNSGFIFSDSETCGLAYDGNPVEVAQATDQNIGEYGRTYELLPRNPRTNQTGYLVYRYDNLAAKHGLDTIDDGQDASIIAIVEQEGEFVGFVACESQRDESPEPMHVWSND